jgi:hypothetical protein
MKAIWQRTFAAFAGRGIDQPSDMMRVTDGEAGALLADLATFDWLAPTFTGTGRHLGYRIANATNAWCTAVFHAEEIVGFYCGSYLWIDRVHRKSGLSTPLILAAAQQRGGSILPPGVVHQGYTAIGIEAHRKAYRHAVRTALAAGLPVPATVCDELRRADQTGKPPAFTWESVTSA